MTILCKLRHIFDLVHVHIFERYESSGREGHFLFRKSLNAPFLYELNHNLNDYHHLFKNSLLFSKDDELFSTCRICTCWLDEKIEGKGKFKKNVSRSHLNVIEKKKTELRVGGDSCILWLKHYNNFELYEWKSPRWKKDVELKLIWDSTYTYTHAQAHLI